MIRARRRKCVPPTFCVLPRPDALRREVMPFAEIILSFVPKWGSRSTSGRDSIGGRPPARGENWGGVRIAKG
jgi:hypothetical protein